MITYAEMGIIEPKKNHLLFRSFERSIAENGNNRDRGLPPSTLLSSHLSWPTKSKFKV